MQVGVLVGGNVGAEFGWFSKAKANQSVGRSTWGQWQERRRRDVEWVQAGQGKNKQEGEGEFRVAICTRAS